MTNGLKVINLQVENVKKLKAVDITPNSHVVEVTGPNGAGKTTALDSIWWALGGTKNIQEIPIRQGQKAAKITLTLGGDKPVMIVTRSFNKSGTTLKVENADGVTTFRKPQEMLDALIGHTSLDPLAFMRMKPKEQRNVLLAGTDFDMDMWAERYKDRFNKRTDIGRQYKTAAGYAEGLPFHKDAPEEEVSVTDLAREIAEANKIISANAAMQEKCNAKRAAVERLTAELEQAKNDLADVQEAMDNMPGNPDISALQEQISIQEAVNVQVRENAIKFKALKDAGSIKDEYEQLTSELADMEENKAQALANLDIGMEGITVDSDGVLYQGLPIEQMSSAEQLRLSLLIAMRENPDLRVLRVTDGSLLDSKSMEIIRQETGDKGYQIWIERVDETGKVGVYIEDGEVKEQSSPS